MSESIETIHIGREELATPEVEAALARERSQRARVIAAPIPVSPVRRVLMNSMFYLPIAALLGALLASAICEPHLQDTSRVAGPILLVNESPLGVRPGLVAFTIGRDEVLVDRETVELIPGPEGSPPFYLVSHMKTGMPVDAIGYYVDEHRMYASHIRPVTEEEAASVTSRVRKHGQFDVWFFLFFPMTGTLIALGLILAEGLSARNWRRMLHRAEVGAPLAALLCIIAFIPAGLVLQLGQHVIEADAEKGHGVMTIHDFSPTPFLVFATCRSIAWACIGLGLGAGMNLARSTSTQLRNSAIGGALGGALGGLFFDPIERFIRWDPFLGASMSRLGGVLAVGLLVGVFVALVERLGREAWLRVRTGPLAGKSFVLYKTPTTIGSAPAADVYLFKDTQIDPDHARIHRVGNVFELEDTGSNAGTIVQGESVRRRRLVSGDQIVIGSTVLEFEERLMRPNVRGGGS